MARKNRGWLVTILVLAGTAIFAALNADKVKEFVAKIPVLNSFIK